MEEAKKVGKIKKKKKNPEMKNWEMQKRKKKTTVMILCQNVAWAIFLPNTGLNSQLWDPDLTWYQELDT